MISGKFKIPDLCVVPRADGSFLLEDIHQQRKHVAVLELRATLSFVTDCRIRSTELFETG